MSALGEEGFTRAEIEAFVGLIARARGLRELEPPVVHVHPPEVVVHVEPDHRPRKARATREADGSLVVTYDDE